MKKLLFFSTLLCSAFALQAKTVYIAPIGGYDIQRMFYDPQGYRDEISKPFCALREMLEASGYTVKFTAIGDNIEEDVTAVISFNETNPKLMEVLSKLPREKSLLFLFDPPVIIPATYYDTGVPRIFGRIFTMFDSDIDNKTTFKFHYPQPRLKVVDGVPSFSEKKLATFVAGNWGFWHVNELYTERRAMVDYMMTFHPSEFDLYGRNWGRHPASIIAGKWDVIKNYKFCFCYENMGNQRGYITEKIFDALVGGAIPIYLGATNIEEYVPKTCFIDRRDFSSMEQLCAFLATMDEVTYRSYREAIDTYLSSPQAQLFSIDAFIETIRGALREIDP
jgi:hypothetical protein